MAVNSTYEYQRMERNNHTSANIEGSGWGNLDQRIEKKQRLALRKFPPMKNIYFEIGKK